MKKHFTLSQQSAQRLANVVKTVESQNVDEPPLYLRTSVRKKHDKYTPSIGFVLGFVEGADTWPKGEYKTVNVFNTPALSKAQSDISQVTAFNLFYDLCFASDIHVGLWNYLGSWYLFVSDCGDDCE